MAQLEAALAKINLRRLWLLFTAVWVLGVGSYYWKDVSRQYSASIRAKADADARRQESSFHECLKNAGTTWFAVIERYGDECTQYAKQQCKKSLWCADEFLRDLCLKGKTVQCQYIYFKSSPSEDSFGWGKIRGDVLFYLRSRFSAPLVNALLLAVVVPLVVALVPRLSRALWRWLTH